MHSSKTSCRSQLFSSDPYYPSFHHFITSIILSTLSTPYTSPPPRGRGQRTWPRNPVIPFRADGMFQADASHIHRQCRSGRYRKRSSTRLCPAQLARDLRMGSMSAHRPAGAGRTAHNKGERYGRQCQLPVERQPSQTPIKFNPLTPRGNIGRAPSYLRTTLGAKNPGT